MVATYREFLENKRQMGSRCGFDPLWMPDFLFDFQATLVEWAIRKGRAAIFADCGLGKGQPASAPVLTPRGWVPIGSLSVGDAVIASDGKPSKVVGVYPKPVQDTYRVHFSDGVSLVFDSDHLHICRTNNDRQRGRPWRVMSTAELVSCGNLRYGAEGKSRNYDIPVVADVEFQATPLSVDPYVLGVLLGDGHLSGNLSVSSADEDLLAAFAARLPECVTIAQKKGSYDWKIMTGPTGSRRHSFRAAVFGLGLLDTRSETKFIPREYLFASPVERLDLLRGLMDTDGYIDPCGTCQFYSVSQALAFGVVHIVRSLGGVPASSVKQTTCGGKPGQPCHVVTFSLATHNPFLLARKADRWNPAPRDNGRWIDRIEFESRQDTVCIAVDSADSSYVTEHFVVTHNTPMQLAWAENVVRKTNKPVLVATPLAVSAQTIREAEKFGIDAQRSPDGKIGEPRAYVTNYERLHYFDPDDFGGFVGDESSVIKNFAGKRRKIVTHFLRKLPYRLLCTATAAPNDYVELGTSSEALGELGNMDMLSRFFKNDNKTLHLYGTKHGNFTENKWRFKPHAAQQFWRWVCSWARAVRKPSDLGFSDERFVLPELVTSEHEVKANRLAPGMLFEMPARTLEEQREETRRTIQERCAKVCELVADTSKPAVTWCHLNLEGDLLEKLIPGAKQVSGSDSDEEKEEAFTAFQDGQIRVLVTKPKIGGFGLNWQHCSHMTFFPSHSFEQWYQCIRRSYRFGQENPVVVDVVTTEGGSGVLANLKDKAEAADRMFADLVAHMNDALRIGIGAYGDTPTEVPSWLCLNRM